METVELQKDTHAHQGFEFSIDSDDGFRACCRNFGRQLQSFSGLQSPTRLIFYQAL